jgi:hypothetical protein
MNASGGAGGAAGAPGAGGTGGAAADPNATIGAFDLKLNAPVPASKEVAATPGFTSFDGQVRNAASPPTRTLREMMKEGDCRLLVPFAPFCDPATCPAPNVCVATSETTTATACLPHAVSRNAGKLTIKGLLTETGPATIDLVPDANYYVVVEPKLAYPAFKEGDDVEVSAAGSGEFPAFTLKSKGISQLELMISSPLQLSPDQALPLRWKPPGQPALTRVQILIDISHHGGFRGLIRCDTSDTGMLDVPAKLVTALIGLGVAGYPTVSITRHAEGRAQVTGGWVDLNVISTRDEALTVAGFTSCNEDKEPCPTGKTCGTDSVCH